MKNTHQTDRFDSVFSHLVAAIAIVASLAGGCGPDRRSPWASGAAKGDGELSDQDGLQQYQQDLYPADPFAKEFTRELRVPLEQMPDYDAVAGKARFTFCPQPVEQRRLNLTNAAWLAMMSAQEYAHLASITPALMDLGFGRGGDMFWPLCGRDLHDLREIEEAMSKVQTGETTESHPRAYPDEITQYYLNTAWGACARDWFEDFQAEHIDKPGQDTPRPEGIAAKFEEYLIQTTDPDSYLQFFSSGSFEVQQDSTGTNSITFARGSTQALWARHQTLPMVVISFRGTEPDQVKDIVADAKFWRLSLEKDDRAATWGAGWGKVHRGFYDAHASVVGQKLLEKLTEVEGTDVGIWVTGHSLGAALATLFTSRILAQMERGKRYRLMGLYTFGSPRVGNPDFAEKFDKLAKQHNVAVQQFRNDQDVVTRIPVRKWPLLPAFYEHVGQLDWFDGNGTLHVDLDPDDVSLRLKGWAAHHSMDMYYQRVLLARSNPALAQHDQCAAPQP